MFRPTLLFPYVLITFEIAVYLSMDMYTPALPYLAKDFNMPPDYAQYTVTTWFIGALFLQLFVGPISDRLGRRPILISGILLFVISSLLCATTNQFSILLIARFLQGSTVAIPLVVGYAAVHESFDDKTAMKILAFMGSITILAPALGPLLGAVIIHYSNWRMIFWVLALWSLVSLVFMFFKMPETLTKSHPLHLRTVISGYFKILRNKDFLRFALPLSLSLASLIIWMIESPFIIVETYHRSIMVFGAIQFCIFAVYIFGSQKLSKLLDKYNPISLLRFGFSLTAIGGILLLFVGLFLAENLYLATLCMMIFAGGLSLCLGPSNRLSIAACKGRPMGSRTAMFASVLNLFGAASTILITLMNNKTLLNLSIAMLIGVLFAFMGSVLYQKTDKPL